METGKAREIFETLKRDISNGKYDAASPMPSCWQWCHGRCRRGETQNP